MVEMIEKLKTWVKETYSPEACGATSEWSAGNYDDCFNDGYNAGLSDAAYTAGQMLGMDLPEPDEPKYD